MEESKLELVKSNGFLLKNTLVSSISLDDSNGFKAIHCTIASLDPETPAIRVDTDNFLITDSILYSRGHALFFIKKKTNRKCLIVNSMIYGGNGYCARETEDGEFKKGDLAVKKSKVKLFVKAKKCVYSEPSFIDEIAGDWRLEDGKPGKKSATDKKDCGVIWP